MSSMSDSGRRSPGSTTHQSSILLVNAWWTLKARELSLWKEELHTLVCITHVILSRMIWTAVHRGSAPTHEWERSRDGSFVFATDCSLNFDKGRALLTYSRRCRRPWYKHGFYSGLDFFLNVTCWIHNSSKCRAQVADDILYLFYVHVDKCPKPRHTISISALSALFRQSDDFGSDASIRIVSLKCGEKKQTTTVEWFVELTRNTKL